MANAARENAAVGRIVGFAPVARRDARVLVLGSMPSAASLERGQYYGLPRNAFWPIMATLFGVGANASYRERTAALKQNRVALWDVLRSCHRPGSLDASIDKTTAETNDFVAFFAAHGQIRQVFFNGRTAEQLFRRAVMPGLDASGLTFAVLPSTSPAHAAMDFSEKLRRWRELKRAARTESP